MFITALLPFQGKLSALAGVVSSFFGWTLSELMLPTSANQYVISAVITIASGIGGALLVAIPRLINARTAARASEAGINKELWDQAEAFKRDQIKFYESRIASKELVSMLERRSKHKALGECQRLVFHINLLENIMRTKSIEPPGFVPKTYEDLVGEEDRQIELQSTIRVAAATADKGR